MKPHRQLSESHRQRLSEVLSNNPKNTGICSNQDRELQRREKIRKAILQRYANGWEVRCGRCKKIDYESPIAGKIKVDGNWELTVAKFLDHLQVSWKRNKERFPYTNLSGRPATYCPDFYVEDWKCFIEVKGYRTSLDDCKWQQFPHTLLIWSKEKIKEIGELTE